jgi:hypothetical protein
VKRPDERFQELEKLLLGVARVAGAGGLPARGRLPAKSPMITSMRIAAASGLTSADPAVARARDRSRRRRLVVASLRCLQTPTARGLTIGR